MSKKIPKALQYDRPITGSALKYMPGARVFPSSRPMPVSLWVFFIGLNAFFILHFLFPSNLESGSTHIGTWRYFVLAYSLIVAGGFLQIYEARARLLRNRIYRVWFWMFLTVLARMVVSSWLAREPMVTILWRALFYLSLPVIALIGQNHSIWPNLNKMFIVHTMVQGTYVLGTILTSNIAGRSDYRAFSSTSILVAPYAVPILLYSFGSQGRTGKLVAGWGYLASIAYYLVYGSRGGILRLIFQLLILAVILWRTHRINKAQLRKSVLALVLIGGLGFAIYNIVRLNDAGFVYRLAMAREQVYLRFISGGGVLETFLKDGRIWEVRALFRQLTWYEWLFGRGVAATWSDPGIYRGAQRGVVHIGYMHYVLQGGVLFLVLMLLPLVWGIRALLKSGNGFTIAAGGCLVQYFTFDILTHVFFKPELGWVLLALAFGRCAAGDGRE